MYYPQGSVAVDSDGNLCIADTLNGRVRKVDTSGNISTFAGRLKSDPSGDNGPATAAQLNIPYGLAVDSDNNLYIADGRNHRIRKVDAVTRKITTVAGGGSTLGDGAAATLAQLRTPYGLAVDSDDNLYIADGGNHRIRKVDTSGTTWTITTVAGTGTKGYSGDDGAATAANLNLPYDVAVDSSGNLYIAGIDSHRVRKVTATGVNAGKSSRVAGTGLSDYGGNDGADQRPHRRGGGRLGQCVHRR